jgi:hypothetical protein
MIARLVLAAAVAAGVCMRLVGLGWGIPRPLPPEATAFRSSYHFDEDKYLGGIARTAPGRGDFDVRDLHWGTLQFYLVWGALEAAQTAGYLTQPWRAAFRDADPENLPRLYRTGRAVSAAAGILTLAVVFLAGRGLRGPDAGLAAAALVAASPLHVVNSHFLTSDVTMTLLLTAALALLLASLDSRSARPLVAAGFLLGLAIAAKYNAAVVAPLWPVRDLLDRARPGWPTLAGYAAIAAGFALGEPYGVARFPDLLRALHHEYVTGPSAAAAFLPSVPGLAASQAVALAFYGLGVAGALAALAGIARGFGRSRPKESLLFGATLLLCLGVVAARWPLVRYTLPLVPCLALFAALALSRVENPRARLVLAAAFSIPPLLFSAAQVALLTRPHPNEQARDWIEREAPPGARIGQLWAEAPLLDRRRFELRPLEPFSLDPPARADPEPDFIVLDDLPIAPWSPPFAALLEARFRLAAEFRSSPAIGRWRLPEPRAPHDWKYTHPVVRIYARR